MVNVDIYVSGFSQSYRVKSVSHLTLNIAAPT